MPLDMRGLYLTGADDHTAAAVRQFQHACLGYHDNEHEIVALAEAVPDCPLVQIYAAWLALRTGSARQIATLARPLVDLARLVPHVTERERWLIEAADAWARCAFGEALLRLESVVERWPEDLIALRFAHTLFAHAPDDVRQLRMMGRARVMNEEQAPFLALLADAQAQQGATAVARETAERALALDLDTPWAHFVLGACHIAGGTIADGLRLFDTVAPTWDGHNTVLRTHNVWMNALLHLTRLDVPAAMALYHRALAIVDPRTPRALTDAISILWRVELVSAPLDPTFWTGLAASAAEHAGEAVNPFLNAHFLYALVRGGRKAEADEALRLMSAAAVRSERWQIGLQLGQGAAAMAAQDAAGAVAALTPIAGRLREAGGSRIENNLFRLTLVAALAMSGQRTAAGEALLAVSGARPPTPFEKALTAPAEIAPVDLALA
ncbi:hypothetical protein [Pseudoxanthobacter sp.]|uniref:hypothetical protein n=1 Tax=Pseudoxanthobacter sp. TaxID=1925742 RepID=UPI002FE39121